MARKVQINKEIILQAALEMLIREGYSTVNIKSLAKEIGCSTQPIAWHFGNMDGLRKELSTYALAYANEKMRSSTNGMTAFTNVGIAYLDIAFDQPNLFRYLYMSGDSGYFAGGFDVLTTAYDNATMVDQIALHLKIPKENVNTFFQNTMIYTHGLASFIASGIIKASKEEVAQMVNQAAHSFLLQAGADI